VNVIESSEILTEIARGLDGEDHPLRRWTHPKNMPITVLLADDAAIMRRAIRNVLESDPEIKIVGETADFARTIQMAADLKPQVVVMDLHMPDATSVTRQRLRPILPLAPASYWQFLFGTMKTRMHSPRPTVLLPFWIKRALETPSFLR